MSRFELYRKPETRQARSGGGGARAFALLLLLWAAIMLWASHAVFGL
jgi:hypothetical protein